MRIALFCHSLISDWNHGNAHFLRGVTSELLARGHIVDVFEPEDAWSVKNLISEQGLDVIAEFHRVYPGLSSTRYNLGTLDLDRALDKTDLVLVHEWNQPELIQRLGRHRAQTRQYRLFFHDTHHRAVSNTHAICTLDLRDYDGVLAFGAILRELYIRNAWIGRAWVWHEAADTRVFKPLSSYVSRGDVVWVGNWGDDERDCSMNDYFIAPIKALSLNAVAYGVRYPDTALNAMQMAGINYRGWLPNFGVPHVFAQFKSTMHVPRRYYVDALQGIPTIRIFEALACGIPLISAPWEDVEHLFDSGRDFLMARDGAEMTRKLRMVLNDGDVADELSSNGLRTIRERHSCAHRVDELLAIYSELQTPQTPEAKHDRALT